MKSILQVVSALVALFFAQFRLFALPTAGEVAEKWQRRTKAAGQDMAAGVARVSEAPGVKAAQQAALMIQKLIESVNSGAWGNAVAAVTLQEWKDRMTKIGIPRVAAGVDAAAPTMNAAFQTLLADISATLQEVNQTPRGDLETNIQRATTMMRGMSSRAKARK